MSKLRTALLGAIASVALLGGASAAFAQSRSGETRTIQVPAGAVVIVLPPGMVAPRIAGMSGGPAVVARDRPLQVALPMGGMPDAFAMMRHMEQLMNQSDAVFNAPMFDMASQQRLMEAAMRGVGAQMGTLPDGAQGVVVTSFSDGHGSCTRRVVYSGHGAPTVQVSSTGGAACGAPGLSPTATRPAAQPDVTPPAPAATRTWRVDNQVRQPAAKLPRMVVAQLSD